jgi:hypothetical protein
MSAAPFLISFIGNAVPDGDHYAFMPCYRVTRSAGDGVSVWIQLTRSAEVQARHRVADCGSWHAVIRGGGGRRRM